VSNRRSALGVVVLVLLVAVVAMVAGAPRGNGRPLDPLGTGPRGTKALNLLLQRFAGKVRVSAEVPGADVDIVVMLSDQLGDAPRDKLRSWVRGGGVAVIADPTSTLLAHRAVGDGAAAFGFLVPESVDIGTCDIAGLKGLRRVSAPSPTLFDVDADKSCFGDSERAFVVQRELGNGTVFEIGGAEAFTNSLLGEGDNAALMTALAAPNSAIAVTIIDGSGLGVGDERLVDLISGGVKLGFLQAIMAFAVLVAWRARRLGAPVYEQVPIAVASNELVAATGRLWQRTGAQAHAASHVRNELRYELANRLDVSIELAPSVAAAMTVERCGVEPEVVRRALVDEVSPDGDAHGDAALVALLDAAEELRTCLNK
jgi:hypothetical protein